MAEYAGLEIRIGGNTTKLTNALKAPTKSAAELQRRIRQITNAMQFDPTNLKNVETRIRLTGDRMQSLQSKAQITREAMRQLGDTMTKMMDKNGNAKSVRQIAEETQNLSLAAKQADERFNRLTGTLAEIYESWNEFARFKGVDILADSLDIPRAEARTLLETTTTLGEFSARLRDIQAERNSFTYTGSRAKISSRAIEEAERLKQLDFHGMLSRGLSLDDVIEEAQHFGIVLEDSAIANVRELQKTFKEAQAEKKAFDDALRFDQMGTDLQRLESEAESLSQTMRKLDDNMTATGSSERFQDLAAEIRKVDAALDNVEGDLQRTKEAMKADPGNIQLAARYYDDLQQKAALAEQKTELLKAQLNMLDANGASEAAKQHQDLAKWVEESAEAARIANKELSDQRATVGNLDDQIKNLKQTISTLKGDETIAEYSNNVVRWKEANKQLEHELSAVNGLTDELAKNQKELDKAQAGLDKANQDMEEYGEQLEKARAEAKRLEEALSELGAVDITSSEFEQTFVALDELNSEITRLETAYNKASSESREFSDEVRASSERVNISNDAVRQAKARVDDLKESIAQLEKKKEVRLFKNPGSDVADAQAELEKLEGELEEATARERELAEAYDSAKTENELAKTAQAARNVSQEMDETRVAAKEAARELDAKKFSIFNPSTVKSMGMTLSATITPFLMGIGYQMIDASSEVDSAYRDMRKTVNGTEEQFEHLRSAAIDFSRTHVTSADQILAIEAIGGELGVATENLETFAEVISNIDVATNLDTESAATALGHLSNILHLTEEDYVGFSDALVRLGNNGASTETEIVNVAERIGSMGSIVGMSGSEILAWSSSIASTGQRAEAAGTAISRTMSFFETAVASAGGSIDASFESINAAVEEGGDKLTVFASLSGMTADEFAESWETNSEEMAKELKGQLDDARDSLQTIADVAHMSSDEFVKAWENDPTSVMKAFIEGLNDMEAAEGSADKVLQDLGIKSVRQKQAIEGLMQTIGGLSDNLEMSKNAWNGVSDDWGEAGDAANEAAKKAEGFSGKVQILKNMWQNFLAELGEGAVPWIQLFTDTISGASEAFSSLSAEAKKWIILAGGITALAGPLLSFAGTVGTANGELKGWFEETTSGFSLAKLAVKHFGEDVSDTMLKSMSKMDKVKLVGAELGTSLFKGLAVGAVAAGISVIIYSLMQLYEQYKTHIAATEGLNDAISDIGRVSRVAADGMDAAKVSVNDLMEEANGADGRLADLAKTLEDSNRQYSNYAGQMEYYARTIETLSGKTTLSKDETYRLEAALQAVNEACNTSYGLDEYGNIIDTETGKVMDNTDAIYANIDARKQQALIDYYSDDYAKAIAEQEDARQTVTALAEEYRRLHTEAGKQEWIDNYIEKTGRADLAEQAFNGHVSRVGNSMRKSKEEFTRTSEAVDTLDEKISTASQKLAESNKVIEDAAKAQEELDRRSETVTADVTGNMKKLSDAATKVGTDDAGFNAIAEGLDAIHVYAKELDKVDMSRLASAFDSTNGSMSEIVKTLEDGGVHMKTWNAALEQAPGSAEKMSSLTAAAFQSMYESAGSDINATMTLIAGLDAVQVNGKTFYITDNGSITDSEGKIWSIKDDLATIPDQVITTYYADDEDAKKKALDTKASLTAVSKQKTTAKIDAKDNASKTIDSVQGKSNKLGRTVAKPTANLRDNATAPLSGISRRLDNLNGRVSTVTINTVERRVKQATGGMNNRPVIPEHATGYIATGPTLTNQGWIGEDGIEAVANWATGGAVVPLTNKRYMLPIADAIADGMMARGGGAGTVNNYYVNDAIVNSDAEIQAVFLQLFDVLARKGAMNRG